MFNKAIRYSVSIIAVFIALASTLAVASKHSSVKNPTNQSMPPRVILYADPSLNAKKIEEVSLSQHLIPFFRHGSDWIKVANPANGNSGWVNIDQFKQTIKAARQQQLHLLEVNAHKKGNGSAYPSVNESVFIQVHPNAHGEPDVVAYRNGQRLTDKEAKALLKNLQAQQNMMIKKDALMQQQAQNITQPSFNQLNHFAREMQ
ncbi:MAG: hypothetical protein AAGA27_04210 [Pseudomonadota bacterium]